MSRCTRYMATPIASQRKTTNSQLQSQIPNKMSHYSDTIAAIATPSGIGGIAVLRLSGDNATAIALRHSNRTALTPRHATYSLFRNGDEIIDDVVMTYYPAPHSYTGEDTVEIACHGSQYIQQTILDILLNSGARMAEPGEYTQRAFINGRLNLAQAEAVNDLIESTNRGAHRLAVSQLRGSYAQRLKELRQQFVELASLLELELDFSEEDVEFADRQQLLTIVRGLMDECWQLQESFRQGNAIRNGVAVAIVGAPNVGKSTILNALVGDDRAIVSDIPGTTRDTIEDIVTIDGIAFRFIDTAGLRSSTDIIENAGIERSLAAARRAQIVLYIVEAGTEADTIEKNINALGDAIQDKTIIVVQNKTDLYTPTPLAIKNITDTVSISARRGEGIGILKKKLYSSTIGNLADDTPIVSNPRHLEALHHITTILPRIEHGLKSKLPADLIVIDLREAIYHLGTITGEVSSPEILSTIFSHFCIGK